MRDLKFILKQKYDTSRALIIGINQYKNASPLGYAVNDAYEVSEILKEELGFEKENVTYLTDQNATKSNILRSYLEFTNDDVKLDDRLFVFFAGHGHTRSGVKGDVGYLVPYDADMNDYSTFIRWDELTRNAELIRAKHILFVMDACYGGLAVNRDLRPGSSRFLRDMYQRFSRQVITAGKANEVVADAGGPLAHHSIFTGHLIEGIKGKAANQYGVITASGLMAYVYSNVANDINSEQTPHYGQFDGDGDFIIKVPFNESTEDDGTKDTDNLITIPYVDEVRTSNTTQEKVEYIKDLISSNHSQIKVHDFLIEQVRQFLSATSEDSFATSSQISDEELLERISSYELHTKDLSMIVACLSYWANESQLSLLAKIISRSCDRLLERESGFVIWVNLSWYPLLLLLYHAGISALEAKNYKSLASIFYTKLGASEYENSGSFFVLKVAKAADELANIFKKIPDYELKYTPFSEYIYKLVQPELDDLLFFGKGYEEIFDEFEILFALSVADIQKQQDSYIWGPIGRFGWKNRRHGISPFQKLRNEAAQHKNNWGPIQAGMFGGKYERFEEVAEIYQNQILDVLKWR